MTGGFVGAEETSSPVKPVKLTLTQELTDAFLSKYEHNKSVFPGEKGVKLGLNWTSGY